LRRSSGEQISSGLNPLSRNLSLQKGTLSVAHRTASPMPSLWISSICPLGAASTSFQKVPIPQALKAVSMPMYLLRSLGFSIFPVGFLGTSPKKTFLGLLNLGRDSQN